MTATQAHRPDPGRPFDPAAAAAAATDRILHDTLHGTLRGVVVDSPPGAGKSTLVVRAARELAAAGRPLMVVAQTNSQVDDLVLRLAEKDPQLPVGRLHSSEPGAFDPALAGLPAVRTSAKIAELAGMDIVVSTAAKWAYTKVDEPWRHAIVDEAYQMRSDALLSVAGLFERALFVGDPGQLDPFSVVGAEQWAGLAYDPSSSAVSTLLAHNPGLPQHRLPVSWRLPASAAPLVSRAFYPYTPFRSGTGPGDRRLAFGVPGDGSGVDRVLDEAAESGWGLLELPARHTPRTDPEAVRAVAQVVRRLLDRGGATTSEAGPAAAGEAPAPAPLTAARIAVGTAHRDQAAAVRTALADLGVTGVAVDTANRLQGREFDVTVVLHPLSGRPDATAFHLETGRLCVLASRHRHACIVVCRAGVADLLDEHPSAEPVSLGVTVKFPDGWEANHAVLAHLAEHRVGWRP
ncbi:AAA domain-containing protein [Streptomyces sp. 2333.5]|uniref:AAA domain-containing protein n=1 Tax=Streptomyces TaxID=1883 RepID=UPI00089B80C9|nr:MULTISPECIES: AAA domain-containing protein [unclassified Streptomyces]PJJ02141.1 AAA domain-containing protein [Streptomyces sp. 2333.5]SEC97282.1 Part of AAA domain-containing protein [Streptomyces sp. 2314.4]SED83239.1 Part of AAA domain-containing protein [Streptomyces sp. 2112.2]SOE13519.1 AAA domain-containing protein [Streptomyces sp. 2323.1]